MLNLWKKAKFCDFAWQLPLKWLQVLLAKDVDSKTTTIPDRRQILLLILSEVEWINFYSPRSHQKTIGFLIILGGIEIN